LDRGNGDFRDYSFEAALVVLNEWRNVHSTIAFGGLTSTVLSFWDTDYLKGEVAHERQLS
jgi:hypothetical protein